MVGRNDSCPCGSGKKYKRCCLVNELDNQFNKDGSSIDDEMTLPQSNLNSKLSSKKSSDQHSDFFGQPSNTLHFISNNRSKFLDHLLKPGVREKLNNEVERYLKGGVSVSLDSNEKSVAILFNPLGSFQSFFIMFEPEGSVGSAQGKSGEISLILLGHLLNGRSGFEDCDIQTVEHIFEVLCSRFDPLAPKIKLQSAVLSSHLIPPKNGLMKARRSTRAKPADVRAPEESAIQERSNESRLGEKNVKSRGDIPETLKTTSDHFPSLNITQNLLSDFVMNFDYPHHLFEAKLPERGSAYLLFSNGVFVDLKDIFYHPYYYVLPSDLRKQFKAYGIKNEYSKIDWSDHNKKLSSNRYFSNQQQIQTLLGWIGDNFAKVNLYISSVQEVRFPSSWHVVKHLGVLSSSSIQAKLELATINYNDCYRLTLSPPNQHDDKDRLLTTYTSLHLSKGELTFRNEDEKIESLNYLISDLDCIEGSSIRIKSLAKPLTLHLRANTQLTELVPELRRKVSALEIDFDIPSKENVFQLRTNRRKEKPNSIDVGLVNPETEESLRFHAQNINFYKFFTCFNMGIAGFFDLHQTELATKSKYKRKHELKLYRHCGFFMFLFSQVLYVLENSENLKHTTDDEKIKNEDKYKVLGKEVLKILWPKLSEHAIRILFSGEHAGDSKPTDAVSIIKDFTTPSFKSNIQYIILKILESRESVYSHLAKEGVVFFKFWPSYLSLFKVVLECLSNKYDHKLFLRSKMDMIVESPEKIIGENSTSYRGPTFTISFPDEPSLIPFLRISELYLDGKRLESVEASDLDYSIQMDDHKDNHPNKIDWFELHPKYFFKGKEISQSVASQLLGEQIVEFHGQYYIVDKKSLPNMKWLEYFWERLLSPQKGRLRDSENTNYHKLPRSQILDMLALRRAGFPVIGGEKWKQVCSAYDKLEESHEKPLDLDSNIFMGQLKDFQKKGVVWINNLNKLGLGGILSDDMGLGKTVQTLAFLSYLHQSQFLGHTLIIVPTSLTYNWDSEFEKFAPSLPREFFAANNKEAVISRLQENKSLIVVTTYGLLLEHSDVFLSQNWNVVVFDEAQNLKNISTQRTTVARKIEANFKLALTGTPMENHYAEFYSLIDLVVPGALGDYKTFVNLYGADGGKSQESSASDIEFLKLKTKPLVLRRTKDQVLPELPEKVESTKLIAFEKNQEKIYKEVAISWNKKISTLISEKGESQSQIQMLTALLRLRQICSVPQSVPNINYNKLSPKISSILDNVIQIFEAGSSVIVFTSFIKSLELLADHLTNLGVTPLTMLGSHSQKQREKTLQTFHEPGAKILIMTLKTGGVGLNLTKANYVFHVEPWWNPSVENQASDRVHRIGQKQSVSIYRYIVKNSVEENMTKLKNVKRAAFDALFGELENTEASNFGRAKLTHKDFTALLGGM